MRFVIFVLSLFCPSLSYAADLTAGEIRSELIGQSIQWWEDGGWFGGELFLLPDGRAELIVSTPKAVNDAGRWTIEGHRICTEWSSMRSGMPKCYSVQRLEEGKFQTSGGNVFRVWFAGA